MFKIKKSDTTEFNASSPQARGERLKAIRKSANLTRQAIETRHGISASTLRSWEDARANGLTYQGARRFITALQNEGIICSIEWLLYGRGKQPLIVTGVKTPSQEAPPNSKEQTLKELNFFMDTHAKGTYCIVKDDGMEPWYNPGDYVAGDLRYGNEINTLIGKACILETEKGETYCRLLRKGLTDSSYTLQCLNVKTTLVQPTLYNVKIVSAAAIIWLRKASSNNGLP